MTQLYDSLDEVRRVQTGHSPPVVFSRGSGWGKPRIHPVVRVLGVCVAIMLMSAYVAASENLQLGTTEHPIAWLFYVSALSTVFCSLCLYVKNS